jgi:hypothetical protein
LAAFEDLAVVAVVLKVGFQKIEHDHKLGKQQNLFLFVFELLQQLHEKDGLSA